MSKNPLIRQDLPVFRDIQGHHAPTPFFLTSTMFEGLGLEIAGGEISDKVGKPVAEPHTHEVAEIYLLLAPEPGGAVIDIVVEGKAYQLTSPAAMFVPAGAQHHFVTRAAITGSYCLGVLLTGAEKSADHASP